MDRLDIIKKLFAAYPNSKPEEATHAVYLEVLHDIPLEELAVIVRQIVSTPGAFPPSAGDTRDLWLRSKGLLPDVDAAERAWASATAAMRGVGSYGVPRFKDPLVAEVVKTMGWQTLCASDNPEADRAHFMRIYNAYAKRKTEQARMTTSYKQLVDSNRNALLERKDDE